MKTSLASALGLLALIAACSVARAEQYLGAAAVLKQVEAQTAKLEAAPTKQSRLQQFRTDLQAYQERSGAMASEEAARNWLTLFDRATKLPRLPTDYRFSSSVPPRLVEVFQVLPAPPVWDALTAQIGQRPAPASGSADLSTSVLKVVAAELQGNPIDTEAAIDALEGRARASSTDRGPDNAWEIEQLREAFLTQTGDKAAILKNFEAKLKRLQAIDPASAEERWSRDRLLDVPDLVAIAGPDKAKALLEQVFAIELLSFNPVARLEPLARQVALEMGDRLKFPPWNLVNSLDATSLYEAIEKRFPAKADPSGGAERSTQQKAAAYYLLGLIAHGRDADAAGRALKLGERADASDNNPALIPEGALNELASKGFAAEVNTFFGRVLDAHPELPYWRSYIEAASQAGETDAMLARVKSASERTDLKPRVKSDLRMSYGDALLAADRVPEALSIFQELCADTPLNKQPSKSPSGRSKAPEETLLSIGRVLGDKTLVNEQLDRFGKLAAARPGVLLEVSMPPGETLSKVYLDANRGAELEGLFAALLADNIRQEAKRREQKTALPSRYFSYDVSNNVTARTLCLIVDLYSRAGRFEDILTLLDQARQWGLDDVAGLIKKGGVSSSGTFGVEVARALQKTGHADAALRVVDATLEAQGGNDPAYALLLELLPPDKAEARLNVLFASDQFQERPLIWRAFLQLGQGRVDEAEKSARQAISIDPSDGEEGRGDRMRAYAILGDILERRGDAEKAAQMRQAVKAIRLSEDADRFHAAGLLSRAISMYEQALGFFSQAYCIQSRLAIQLTALGKFDEGMAHYERAYELMPESFGRMESHCFGCERAFAGKRPQGAAEKVFGRLIVEQPLNPRVHYLMGYLRHEQGRDPEAAGEFREAVRLDPDYINAWKQLADATDDSADRTRAALNLLRLDPRQIHDSANLEVVGDLRALWAAAETAAQFNLPEPTQLYPLSASKSYLEQQRQDRPAEHTVSSDDVPALSQFSRYQTPLTPRLALLRNEVIANALRLLGRDGVRDIVETSEE